MKLLTAAQMREVDRRTIEAGTPSLILMENAACRAVEELERACGRLAGQRVLVICGKGNNGGDGLAIARQIRLRSPHTRLWVVLALGRELSPDAQANLKMLELAGVACEDSLTPEMQTASVVVDALLGTGLKKAADERASHWIREINQGFPLATRLAVDIPSGMPSDEAAMSGDVVRADLTVTFTAPKIGMALWPNCESTGRLVVGRIGSPASYMAEVALNLSEAAEFGDLFAPRPRESNKGRYGHVLVLGGAAGKTGAAAMTGLAALRAGAGLVTVSSSGGVLTPELMTEADPSPAGKTVVAMGPGLGADPAARERARDMFAEWDLPMLVDADGLNALAEADWRTPKDVRVLTPHPGEMARLTRTTVADVQRDRLGVARAFAMARGVILALKGNRTVIALPDGRAWINPTGSPALATAGTGDILAGIAAGLMAQHPTDPARAVIAAVWLHGRCAELCRAPLIATDLLARLPDAIDEIRNAQ